MVEGAWLVIVDVAPCRVRDRIDRTLRNLGFVQVLPCIYRSRWLDPERSKIMAPLRAAVRQGVGRIAVARLDRNGLDLIVAR